MKFEIPGSSQPLDFDRGRAVDDFAYQWRGQTYRRADFMLRLRVGALLVIANRQLRLQSYHPDPAVCSEPDEPVVNDDKKLYGIASLTKSITSTLFGLALLRDPLNASMGLNTSVLSRPITDFVPELGRAQSRGGFDQVPVERILRMRSGARFNEGSDRHALRRVFDQPNGSALAYLQSLPRAGWFSYGPSNGGFNYSGADAQAIGHCTERVARTKLTALMSERLWEPLGMRSRAKWLIDGTGTAAASCCFNATAPDLARFGQFVLDRGANLARRRLLPEEWFDLATLASAVDDIPRNDPSYNRRCENAPTRYRFQWWARSTDDVFMAVGIAGQFISILPARRMVIVQISGWPAWDDFAACESFAAHDAIARTLA